MTDDELAPMLEPDPLDLRNSMTAIIHWAASHEHRLEVMQAIEFPVDDVAMFLIVNQITYKGAMRPSDLSWAVGTGAANISKIVSRLEKLGLVHRVKSPTDDRSVLVALTDEGRVYGARILENLQDTIDRALLTWSPDEAEQLRRVIGRYAHDTTAHTRYAVPRPAPTAYSRGG